MTQARRCAAATIAIGFLLTIPSVCAGFAPSRCFEPTVWDLPTTGVLECFFYETDTYKIGTYLHGLAYRELDGPFLTAIHHSLWRSETVPDEVPSLQLADVAVQTLDRLYAYPFGREEFDAREVRRQRLALWRARAEEAFRRGFSPVDGRCREGSRTVQEAAEDLRWFTDLIREDNPVEQVAEDAVARIRTEDDPEVLALLQLLLYDTRPLLDGDEGPVSSVADQVCEALAERYATDLERRRIRWNLPEASQRLAYWQMWFVARCREALLAEPSWAWPKLEILPFPNGENAYFIHSSSHDDLRHVLMIWGGDVFNVRWRGAGLERNRSGAGMRGPLPALVEVPDGFLPLRHLLSVVLSSAGLRVLPSDLSCWPSLVKLDLSGNGISTLPPSIGSLKGLSSLILDRNQLKTLPEEIGYLPRLERLIVCDNPLRSLPESIVYLRSLKALDVSNTLIPAAEVEELRRRLPGVEVRFRQGG
jgi:hypothetical protein